MKISGVHASIQWFVVLLAITLFALFVSMVAGKLDAPGLSSSIVTGVVVLWAVIGLGGAAFVGGMISTRLIEKGAEIGTKRDGAVVQREAIAAQAQRTIVDGFRLGYQASRSLPESPMLPMGDDNLLPVLEMWRPPLMIESGEEQ